MFTIAEYEVFVAERANSERRFELIHGEIVEKSRGEERGAIAAMISHLLLTFILPRKLGRVAVEPRHQVSGDNHNARLPDVAFTSTERALPVVKQGGVPQMPDLAIEIKSPDDRVREMREKADYYLRNGARMVWLVYPESQSMEVCTLNADYAMQIDPLAADEALHGGGVLPEFSVTVSDFFNVS
jgi:Uma2 family endonuclease